MIRSHLANIRFNRQAVEDQEWLDFDKTLALIFSCNNLLPGDVPKLAPKADSSKTEIFARRATVFLEGSLLVDLTRCMRYRDDLSVIQLLVRCGDSISRKAD